jgi:hypothetical protein
MDSAPLSSDERLQRASSFLHRALSADLSYVISIALLSRILIYAVAYLANTSLDKGRRIREVMCSWDCGWYLSIIEHGYMTAPSGHQQGDAANWGFFPVYPMLSRLVALASGLPPLLAAQLVSNLLFIAGMVILFAYCLRSFSKGDSRFIVTAFAFSPFSLYFSAPYTESTYFFLLIGSLYLASSGRWVWAGVCAAVISATRPPGVLLFFALLILAVQQYGWRSILTYGKGSERAILALALVPLGLFLYILFLHLHVGDGLAFSHVQSRAWGREFDDPVRTLWDGITGTANERYESLSTLVALAIGLYLLFRRFAVEAAVLLLGTLLPLSTGLASMPRYSCTLYPIYVAFGLVTTGMPKVQSLLLCVLSVFLGCMIVLWVNRVVFLV